MVNQHNTHVQSFMSLHELALDNAPTNRYKIVIHADKRPANEHVRRYNGPPGSEGAVLIPGNVDGMIGKRDILVRKQRPSQLEGQWRLGQSERQPQVVRPSERRHAIS